MVRNIPNDWLVTSDLTPDKIFDDIKTTLLKTRKIPKYAYSTILESCSPERQILFWNDLRAPEEVDWEKTHVNNFKCTISTRIRSFYFKLFHRAIGLNDFLYKIKRKDSPNCSFCNTDPETYIHILVECPIWDETVKAITQKTNKPLNISQHLKKCSVATLISSLHICFFYLNIIFTYANSKENHQTSKVINAILRPIKNLSIVLPKK